MIILICIGLPPRLVPSEGATRMAADQVGRWLPSGPLAVWVAPHPWVGWAGGYHPARRPFGSHHIPGLAGQVATIRRAGRLGRTTSLGAGAGRVVLCCADERRKGYPRPVGLGVAFVPLAERLPSGPSASGSRSCHPVLGPAMLPGGCSFCGSLVSLRASSPSILWCSVRFRPGLPRLPLGPSTLLRRIKRSN